MAMILGLLGRSFGKLGAAGKGKATPEVVITGPGGIGSPMGLLLALTYSS